MSGENAPQQPKGQEQGVLGAQLGETYFTQDREIVVVEDVNYAGHVKVKIESMIGTDGVKEETFESLDALTDYLISKGVTGIGRTERAAQAEKDLATDTPQPPGLPKEVEKVEETSPPPQDPPEIIENAEPKEIKKPTKIKIEVQEGTTMSGEKPPEFSPLEEAKQNGDEHRKRYYSMVGDTSDFPDHDTFSAAHKDMADYLGERPYKDAKDNIHSGENAKFMKKDETENEYHDRIAGGSLETTDQFKDKSVVAVARMVAEARSRGDVTGAKDAEDAVAEQLTDMAQRNGWSDEAFSAQIDRLDKIMNGEAVAGQPEGSNGVAPGNGPAGSPEGGNPTAPGGGPANNLEGAPVAPNGEPAGAPEGGPVSPDQAQASTPEPATPEGGVPAPDAAPATTSVEGENAPVAPELDPNALATPEQRAQLAELARQAGNQPAPAEAAVAAQATQEQQAREAQREADVNRMIAEINGGTLGDTLRDTMSRYVELKADSETKGKGFFGIGRTKREKILVEAERAVFDAKLKFGIALADRKRDAGMYEGDEAQMRQQAWVDIFNGVRSVDEQSRKETDLELDRRKEKRNFLQRGQASIGRFFMRGGKVSQGLKGAGAGFVTSFGVAISGVGLPITTGVMLAAAYGLRSSATVANLDRIRAENKDAQGNAVKVMSDDQFRQLLVSMDNSGLTYEEKAGRIARNIFDKSRVRGYEQADRARKDTRMLMGGFTVGSIVGGLTGNWAHDAISQAGATSTGGAPNQANDSGLPPHSNIHNTGSGGNVIASAAHNFAPNADLITNGEGWFHQFADMGMTPDQARAIFSDPTVMHKLVENGAAYVDNSARIGGYGINMPAGGHLSAEAMKVIGDAMTAKGY